MAQRPANRYLRFVRDRSNRGAIIALVATTLVLLVAAGNLVVVAFDPLAVSPAQHPVVVWSLGREAQEGMDSRLEWAFLVETGGRPIVDLDIRAPYRVTVTHHEGQSRFSSLFALRVDGESVASTSRHTSAMPGDAGESWTEGLDLGQRLGRVSLDRDPEEEAFVLLLTLDWSHVQQETHWTRFDIEMGPVRVEAADLPGIPGCTSTGCAQALFVVALVAQGGGVFLFLNRWQGREKIPGVGPASGGRGRERPVRGARRTDKKK